MKKSLGRPRKFTDEQVEEIKVMYATGDLTQGAIAKQFGVHVNTINRLIKGKSYTTGVLPVDEVEEPVESAGFVTGQT